jgi:hypothetical protein
VITPFGKERPRARLPWFWLHHPHNLPRVLGCLLLEPDTGTTTRSDEAADMSLTIPLPPRDTSPPSSEPQSPGSIIAPDVCPARPLPIRIRQLTRWWPCSPRLRMECRAVTRQSCLHEHAQLALLTVPRSTKSVNQSIFDYVRENGRTYHRYKPGCKAPFLSRRQGNFD